ncbi:MAG TPA: zinc-ribbon domain-containing protein [Conexivisphaerales archaeon]|nr:zinc-ribbon domain-containing protein [Conexivisphaerales archaeon]
MAFCTTCGRELAADAKFCPNCGTAVSSTTSPAGGVSGTPVISVEAGTGKYCQHCGAVIPTDAEMCPRCGKRVMAAPWPSEQKNPGIAAVLSFLFTGLGQIYNGQIGKGITFVAVGIVCLFTIIFFVGLILYPLFWIYNVYDAYNSAKRINAGLERPD